ATPITEAFTAESFVAHYGERAIPMFLVSDARRLLVYTDDQQPIPEAGQTLISLVEESSGEPDRTGT
ncbi:MAG: hypothetical protein ACYTJ0_20635, partial [Planctomycetota bacterium]